MIPLFIPRLGYAGTCYAKNSPCLIGGFRAAPVWATRMAAMRTFATDPNAI